MDFDSFNLDLVIEKPFVENEIDALDGGHTKDYGQDDNLRYLMKPFEDLTHIDDVKDVVEIYFPFKAVVTACHDGKVRIIDMKLRRQVGMLDSGHKTGIRRLDYTPFHGGAMTTVGYESFFNLWEMDGSLSFGKFE